MINKRHFNSVNGYIFSKAVQTVEKTQKTNTRENQFYHRMNNQVYVHSWEEYDYE